MPLFTPDVRNRISTSEMEDTGLMDHATGTDAHALGDIQNYLASFNKEIGDVSSIPGLSNEQASDQHVIQVGVHCTRLLL